MSDGLIVLSGLRGSGVGPPIAIPAGSSDASLLIGMPSIIYSGSLLALIDVPPRISICAPAPGSPLFCVIWTPVARPYQICYVGRYGGLGLVGIDRRV